LIRASPDNVVAQGEGDDADTIGLDIQPRRRGIRGHDRRAEDAAALTRLAPAPRTIAGARDLLSVALQYGNAFLRGFQAAALKPADFFGDDDVLYLMEDMATGEIRLSILWEWLHKGAAFTADDVAATIRRLMDPNTHSPVGDTFQAGSGNVGPFAANALPAPYNTAPFAAATRAKPDISLGSQWNANPNRARCWECGSGQRTPRRAHRGQ